MIAENLDKFRDNLNTRWNEYKVDLNKFTDSLTLKQYTKYIKATRTNRNKNNTIDMPNIDITKITTNKAKIALFNKVKYSYKQYLHISNRQNFRLIKGAK